MRYSNVYCHPIKEVVGGDHLHTESCFHEAPKIKYQPGFCTPRKALQNSGARVVAQDAVTIVLALPQYGTTNRRAVLRVTIPALLTIAAYWRSRSTHTELQHTHCKGLPLIHFCPKTFCQKTVLSQAIGSLTAV